MSQPVAPLAAIDATAKLTRFTRMRKMSTRRMAYWWFRFVVSGRFLEKFLKLRNASKN